MQYRTCSKCGESKPETTEYFRKRGTKDRGGLRPDCRVCTAARDREYFQRNRERILADRRSDGRHQAYMAEYLPRYFSDPAAKAKRIERAKAFNSTERGKQVVAASQRRRRARRKHLAADFTADQWLACLEHFDQACAYCGATEDLAQEHVVPESSGGGYTASNIVPACRACNSRKYTTPLDEWFPAQPSYTAARMERIRSYLTAMEAPRATAGDAID